MSPVARLKFASGGIFYGLFLISVALNMYAATVMFSPCSVAYGQSTICNEGDQRIDDGGRIVNEDGGAAATDDFRVETDGNANAIDTDAAGDAVAFFQDASTNTVPFEILGNSKITGDLEVTGSISGIGVASYAFKPADTTRTLTTTLADDPDLVLPVLANKHYAFEMWISENVHNTPDLKIAITMPAGATLESLLMSSAFASADDTYDGSSRIVFGTATVDSVTLIGAITVAGTAGNVTLQWAQNTSDANNTTLLEGSWIRLTQLD